MSDAFVRVLTLGGMGPVRARAVAAMAGRAEQAVGGAEAVYFVPGRIELLGKHTDYAGGRSLLCAVEWGLCVAARSRADAMIRVRAVDLGEDVSCPWDAESPVTGPAWARYPASVVRRLAPNFPGTRRGADVAFVSDLPVAAGLSSSSALVIASFLALADVNALAGHAAYSANIHGGDDLAAYLATIENGESFRGLAGAGGVGTFGGSEDHTAILGCQADAVSQYAFAPVREERVVPFPAGHVLVVADSGVAAEKTGAARDAYNRASLAARAVLEIWRDASGWGTGSLAQAAASSPDAPARIRAAIADAPRRGEFSAQALLDRFDQFWHESAEFVPTAAEAVAAGDLARFGTIVDHSQEAAERLLGNQVPETVALQRMARELGAEAASAFGAGFGGSVWAMVIEADAFRFGDAWLGGYRTAFPGTAPRAQVLVTRPGPPATELRGSRSLLPVPRAR